MQENSTTKEISSPDDSTAEDEKTGSLGSITQGASLFFVGRVVSNGLRFGFNLLMTRVLGAAYFGIYTYAKTIIGFTIIFARLGTGKSLLRFIPASSEDPLKQNWIVGVAYLTAFAGSVVIGSALFFLAPTINDLTLGEPLLTDVLRILALVLPFNTFKNLTNAVFRAYEKVEYKILIQNVVQPLVQIGVVSIAFLLGYSLVGATAALALGGVLTFSVAFSLLYSKTDVRFLGERTRGSYRDFYNYSLPLTLKDLGQKLYTRVDLVMVGIFLASSTVGIYRVSILLATLLTLPLKGINQLFPPIASDLYSEGNVAELESVYKIVTRWILTVVIPPTLAIVFYSPEVLRVFGAEFTTGELVLVLFAIAQFTNCAVGPSGYLLMMTDHQYLNLLNQWLLGVLNVVLNYLLITQYGFIGAAVATAGTLAFINLLRVIEVWHLEGMTPYSTNYWKPVVAGLISGVVFLVWRPFFDGYWLLAIGSTVGTIVFATTLFLLGIEEDDKEFYAENIGPVLEDKLS